MVYDLVTLGTTISGGKWVMLWTILYKEHSLSWHSNASNPFRMVGIGIRMLRIPFEWLELAFECFESQSNGRNWHSNASNPNRMVGIGIRIL